ICFVIHKFLISSDDCYELGLELAILPD
ncbi:unnamed protein product, partial [Allacma fusca]